MRCVRLLRRLSCYWLQTGMGQSSQLYRGIGRHGVLAVSIVVLLLLFWLIVAAIIAAIVIALVVGCGLRSVRSG